MVKPRRKSAKCVCGAVILLLSSAVHAQQLSQPNPCIRWGHSSTLGASSSNTSAASTLYIYGGDAKTSTDQTAGTRTNALISLDLTEGFSIASPPFNLVKADNGNPYDPPQTSLGAMWSSTDGKSLFYQGGYTSEQPLVAPDEFKLYQYNVDSSSWSTVQTRGDTVLRVAEGSSAVIPPEQGTNSQPIFHYFGGHLDSFTVQGWSNQVPRVYLNSMIEYDGASSTWTNRSTYASTASVTANSTWESAPLLRADATLTYVPGLGTNGKGILVSIGGGNFNQMMDNNILDVYDLGAQGWVKQATQGAILGPRVSHCAVRGSAKIGGVLQHQIFVYGGQASNRTTQILQGQNSDLYVLSLPSFTWTFVGSNLPSQPTGRAAHTCTLMGSQMIVVGGFVSEDLICEQPGVYVLDTSELKWVTSYTANTVYTTPNHPEILAVTGGRGTGSSVSGSGYALGTGVNDTDTSASFARSNGDGGGESNTGAIAGGVVGGILGALLIAGLLFFFWRKRKQEKEQSEKAQSEKHLGGSHSSSPGSFGAGNPYEEALPADDDVENTTQGFNAQFSHLVPRQTLRVVNA